MTHNDRVTDYLLDVQPALAQVIAATTGAATEHYVQDPRGLLAQQDAAGGWHIANQRANFQHKLSTWMTRRYGLMALENLHINGMVKNHRLAKSISDAGWAQFVQMCVYKGDWYGCEIAKVGRFFPSSRQGSGCGSVNRALKRSDRKWVCPDCGRVLHRDQNAAPNILHEALTGRSRRFSCGAQEYTGGADIRPQHAWGASVETWKSNCFSIG
ncbi:MAG: transposase [Chloroflexi bacterium]|nr:transposase [Chloroflexota bacterium]